MVDVCIEHLVRWILMTRATPLLHLRFSLSSEKWDEKNLDPILVMSMCRSIWLNIGNFQFIKYSTLEIIS
jgi:hypothetical protein